MQLQLARFDGTSWDPEPSTAMDSEQTLLLAFGSPSSDAVIAALDDLRCSFPKSHIAGCSTAGEIFSEQIYDGGLVLAIVRFSSSNLCSVSKEVSQHASFETGCAIGEQLNDDGLKAVFMLSEGLHINGSELVEGLNSKLPVSVVTTGGMAADDSRFEETWVYARSGKLSNYVVALGLYGDRLEIGHGSRGGWNIFGIQRRVTRSKKNVLYELDGKPALALYKTYLGEQACDLPGSGLLFPLALLDPDEPERQTVRTVLAVDETTQSITYAGNIPEGSMVQLMCANYEQLINGAADAAEAMITANPTWPGPSLGIAISCVGRRMVLGERAEEEVEAVLDLLPRDSGLLGFYSYGEIAPHNTGYCDLHNQTMTLTMIGER